MTDDLYIPKRVRHSVHYVAGTRNFTVTKLSRGTYHLRDDSVSERSRFGTLAEIREDIRHTLDCGCLPPAQGSRF